MSMPRIAVVYYSATGNVHALAEAIAEGARTTGADVRLRRVAELSDVFGPWGTARPAVGAIREPG
jgi:multimeric flavodoxin WrbA